LRAVGVVRVFQWPMADRVTCGIRRKLLT